MRKLLVFINFPASSCILTIKQSVFSRFSTLKNLAIDNIDFSRNDFSNTLPCHGQSLKLEVTNSHPLDKNIIFYESNHSYFINKSKAKYSVTNYIGKYFEKFIPETAVQKMITGPNWPRPGYINEDGVPYTEKEIFEQWDRISLNARNRGTWMHYNIEGYLNDLPTCFDVPELQQFHEFYNENVLKTNLQPYRTEWRIAAPDLKLAGSVDFVGQRPDKTYEIIDWKRAQKLEMSLTSQFGKRAKPPLQHLHDCDGTKYFLQLNLYRYILETYYDIPIAAMTVASFHPDLDSYFAVAVPRLDREVEVMVEDLKRSASM